MKHLLVACCLASAWSISRSDAQTPTVRGADVVPKTAAQAPWAARNQADMARMDHAMSSTSPASNEDQAFVEGMIPHHEGAVDMAKVELTYGHNPQMRELARSIIAAQEHELQVMHEWQKSHPNAS